MFSSIIYATTLLSAAVNAHGVILAAQGPAGPASVGFQVDPNIARNCTLINPCQQDSTIIRDAEITANIVNTCGRTELTGNIDIGENTENAIAANQVTSVTQGSTLTMTIHQVNADGAGPYTCDLDETSNAGSFTQNLTVTNNIPGANGLSQAKFQAFNMTVTMPDKMACFGGSTGNVCTVRCRNNAAAGPFGGCVAVMQTDVAPTTLTPATVKTAAKLAGVYAQVLSDQKDLPAANQLLANAGTNDAVAAAAVASGLAGLNVVQNTFPTQTPEVTLGGAAAAAPAPAAPKASSAPKASPAPKAAGGAGAAGAAAGGKKGAKGAAKGEKKVKRDLSMRWAKRMDVDA